jgi:Domain of unknown function (DUF222)/HNH endonuclease
MISNRCSDRAPQGLQPLAEVVDGLAAQDLEGLSDAALAEHTLALRRLVDRLEGQWLQHLAAVDGRGAAGADQGVPAASTASWLRGRLRMGASAAHSAVRTARALFRGPLTQTAQALCTGELSPAHAAVLAHGTSDLATHTTAEAEPVLVEAARRLDPPRLRRLVTHLHYATDPDGADAQAQRRHGRRGFWVAPTWEGMVAVGGLLEPEAGQLVADALEPLARPSDAQDARSGDQRRADALTELARRALEGGQLPQTGGVRPQLLVTVDLNSISGRPGALGGEAGWTGPLSPEACRRLACDGALTRVLVSHQPSGHPDGHDDPSGHHDHRDTSGRRGLGDDPGGHDPHDGDRDGDHRLAARLRAAMNLLPPILGGAPSQPLDVGRASRVVSPAQRSALAVRDGGCVFRDCTRPLAWCEGHHLVHWADGGPPDLANLALLCRAHHRVVHEGGWQLTRGPDGHFTATPPDRPHRPTGDIPPPEPGCRCPAAAPPTVPGTWTGPTHRVRYVDVARNDPTYRAR